MASVDFILDDSPESSIPGDSTDFILGDSYTPPVGNQVGFNFQTAGYTPPVGNQINLEFSPEEINLEEISGNSNTLLEVILDSTGLNTEPGLHLVFCRQPYTSNPIHLVFGNPCGIEDNEGRGTTFINIISDGTAELGNWKVSRATVL